MRGLVSIASQQPLLRRIRYVAFGIDALSQSSHLDGRWETSHQWIYKSSASSHLVQKKPRLGATTPRPALLPVHIRPPGITDLFSHRGIAVTLVLASADVLFAPCLL